MQASTKQHAGKLSCRTHFPVKVIDYCTSHFTNATPKHTLSCQRCDYPALPKTHHKGPHRGSHKGISVSPLPFSPLLLSLNNIPLPSFKLYPTPPSCSGPFLLLPRYTAFGPTSPLKKIKKNSNPSTRSQASINPHVEYFAKFELLLPHLLSW